MKKLKQLWNRGMSYLLSTLLACLGFASCDSEKGENPMICMYGTPTATFAIKGKVVNESGKALSGIQVVVPSLEFGFVSRPGVIPDHPNGTLPLRDTLYTTDDGQFVWHGGAFNYDTVRYHLQFNDIRPVEDAPLYLPDSLKVTFLATELKNGDGAWNRGYAEKKVEITLKEKKDE